MGRNPETMNAIIQEVDDGAYYPVRLKWLPSEGDLIKLYSILDTKSGHDPMHAYEVVKVAHDMHDVTHDSPDGAHGVVVFVRPSSHHLIRKIG